MTGQVGHGNDGPEYYASILGAILIESDAAGYVSFNSAKSFGEDPHFKWNSSRIAFERPKGLKSDSGAVVELIQKPV